MQAGCAWLELEAPKPEEQKPEETYWVIPTLLRMEFEGGSRTEISC